MSFLSSLGRFFKEEKIYGFLLILLVGVYVYLHFIKPVDPKRHEAKESPAVSQYRVAEEKFKSRIEEAGSLKQFMRQNPEYAQTIGVMSFVIVSALGVGIFLCLLLIFSPELRRKLDVEKRSSCISWRLSMILKVILLFIAVSIGTSFIFAIAAKLIPSVRGISQNVYLLIHTIMVDSASFLLIWRFVKKAGGSLKDIGFWIPSKNIDKEALVGVGAYLALLPIFIVVMLISLVISDMLKQESPPHALVNVFLEEKDSMPITLFSIFLATVIGPFLEEIFFRGFCYNVLKYRLGQFKAMFLSSAFFALIHANAFAFFPIMVLGMGLAYVYEKRQSVIAPTILHITHNTLLLIYFFLAKGIVSHSAGL